MNTYSEKEKSSIIWRGQKISFPGSVRFLYEKVIKPKSSNEDLKRHEFILNILVAVSIILSGIFSIFVAFYSITKPEYKGISFGTSLFVVGFFLVLLLLSRKGLFVFSSYLLVGTFFILVTSTLYNWGVELPAGLITYSFSIVMAGVLISTRFAFELTFLISFVVILLTYFQTSDITHPNLYWKPEELKMNDAVQFAILYISIAIVSWLSNRETERSLKRAIKSEAELKEERDMLEIRVQERTRELEKSQMEKMNQAARFIEFGKISSGLFHDLINHINFLFLNIEQATEAGEKELAATKEYLKQANENKSAITEYIEDAKKQFQNQKIESLFSVKKEVLSVAKILAYKLKTEKVEMNLSGEFDILTYGNAVRFNHVMTNIILNAMDAYEICDKENKEININLERKDKTAVISIEDQAGGMPEEIHNKIFDPFFTTKGPQKGAGIGLTTAKNTIEEDFGGTIKVETVWGQRTKFIIEFPIRNEPDNPK